MKEAQLGTPVGRSFKQTVKNWRAWALMIIAVLTVLVVGSMLQGSKGALDPNSPAPQGTKAFFNILGRHTDGLKIIHDADKIPEVNENTTVVFVNNRLNSSWVLQEVFNKAKNAKRLVLLDPAWQHFDAVGIQADTTPNPTEDELISSGRCPNGLFGEVTTVTNPSRIFVAGTMRPPVQCFLNKGASAVGIWPASEALLNIDGEEVVPAHPEVVAFAGAEWFTNQKVALAQNGALGVSLLTQTPEVVVLYLDPDYEKNNADDSNNQVERKRLFPAWVNPSYYLLLVTVVFVIIYKRRRFGRLAYERLPITVKSSETTQALGRLYEQNHASGRAAHLLQQDALRQLRKALYQAPQIPDAQVVALAAVRTQRTEAEVHALLLQPFNGSNQELASFNQQLNALIQEVTHD